MLFSQLCFIPLNQIFAVVSVFFDQLLADYLTQLNNVKDLLSWRDPLAEETYNYKTLSENEIHDFEKIFTDYEKYQSFVLEPVKIEKNRRNRFLDHLLARFNEKLDPKIIESKF